MKFSVINWFRRSLLGQMFALTIMFLLFAVVYFALMPYLRFINSIDPLEDTRVATWFEVTSIGHTDVIAMKSRLANSEILQEVQKTNPSFRYFIKHGDLEVQFGDSPKWIDKVAIQFPDIDTSGSDVAATGIDCTSRGQWRSDFEEFGVSTMLSYRFCDGEVSFVEIAGVDKPIPRFEFFINSRDLSFFWSTSRELVIATLGFIVIAGLVLLRATRSLAKVTHTAQAIDTLRDHPLPERAIPTEVLPLVSAINKLMDRLSDSQEQQQFFLATAAHEMRTPMTILRTRLEDLPESTTKLELRNDIQRITTLVEQLLQLMSIRTKEDTLEEVDVVCLVEDILADRAPVSMAQGVDIELTRETSSLHVKGDRQLLGVALSNLVDNAISFSQPNSTLRIRIDTTCVWVEDEGPGIADDVLQNLFEPFAKSPPARKGHGLGLAIVKAIMNLHGGDVSASNRVPQGASFALKFVM